MMGFEEVEHTADKALRIFGANLTEFFLSAAAGLTHLMAADVSDISTEIEKTIELDAIDAESLLVEWLSELAYWAEQDPTGNRHTSAGKNIRRENIHA
jgi:SHS2 domain-containing protein